MPHSGCHVTPEISKEKRGALSTPFGLVFTRAALQYGSRRVLLAVDIDTFLGKYLS